VQDEDLSGIGVRATVLQIVSQGRPDLAGQRQKRAVAGLAGTHPHDGVAPVEILKPQLRHLTRPQPQPPNGQDDRPVSQVACRGRLQRSDQLFKNRRVQMPNQAGRTMRHHRDGVRQPVLTPSLRAQEREETT